MFLDEPTTGLDSFAVPGLRGEMCPLEFLGFMVERTLGWPRIT